MSASPTRRRPYLRSLGAALALALVAIGVTPLAAHAAGELLGGPTPGAPVAVPAMPVTGGSFRATNVGIDSSGYSVTSVYVNVAWYAYTPASNGVLDVVIAADGAYDVTLEVWAPDGSVLGRSDSDGDLTRAAVRDLEVTGGSTYLIGMGGWRNSFGTWPGYVDTGTASINLALEPVPTPPTGVRALAGPESATIAWDPPVETYGPLTGYVVWYRPLPDGVWQTMPVAPTETSATLTGLTGGQEYAVRVRARNAAGASEISARALVTPLITPVITLTTTPNPPTNRDAFDVTVTVTRNGEPSRGQITVQIGAAPARSFFLGADGVHTYRAAGRVVGTYPVTVSYAGSPDGLVVPLNDVPFSIVVTKDSFPLGFELGGPFIYGGTAALAASTPSGVTVTFASTTPDVCTVSGTTVTFVDVGACSVTATQPETAEIFAATATDAATVLPSPQTVAFVDPPTALTFGQPGVPVAAAATSGLAPVLAASGACVLDAGVLTTTGAGTCTLTADQAGSAQWLAAPQASVTIPVAQRPQAVSFSTFPALLHGVVSVPVTATSDVGLPVTITASGACMYDDGAIRTLATGTCTVAATQPGDADTLPGSAVATIVVAAGEHALSAQVRGVVGDDAADARAIVSGTGLKPGTALTLTVYSAPTQIGLVTVAMDGGVGVEEALPPGLAAGTHRLVARGVALDGTAVERIVAFGVAEDGSLAWIGAPPALPRTGADPQDAGLMAALWVLAGVGLLLARRIVLRRRFGGARA